LFLSVLRTILTIPSNPCGKRCSPFPWFLRMRLACFSRKACGGDCDFDWRCLYTGAFDSESDCGIILSKHSVVVEPDEIKLGRSLINVNHDGESHALCIMHKLSTRDCQSSPSVCWESWPRFDQSCSKSKCWPFTRSTMWRWI